MLFKLKKEDFWFIGLLLIIAIVFSINLGLMPLLADEPIRALVSLEMLLNNNFIYPTFGGEAYLNKPPLFNWLIASTSFNHLKFSEWHLRVIPVISFLAISILHYFVCSKYVSKKIALWSSIAFLTSGRILFYDSLMGYIDPLFSLVILANFYLILIGSKKNKLILLFVASYLLCTIAFFLKGLPACAFQVCTLLAVFIYRNKFNQLIRLPHLSGICLFIIVLSIYYYEYGSYGSVENALRALISQSTQRTPLSTSIYETITHCIQFPFQFIIDFLPFSLLLLFCFHKNIIQTVKENDFVFGSIIVVGANLWLYWISPETRPRYLFMFVPLFYTIIFHAYDTYKKPKSVLIIRCCIIVIAIFSITVLLILPFLPHFKFISNSLWISIFSVCILLLLVFLFYKKSIHAVLMLILILIILRIDFSLFILPLRKKEAPESVNKNVGITLARLTQGHPLTTLYHAPINDDIRFYATLNRGEIIYNKFGAPKESGYYIVNIEVLNQFHLTPVYQFYVTYESRTLYLVKK